MKGANFRELPVPRSRQGQCLGGPFKVNLAADDGLNAFSLGFAIELNCSEKIARIGHRNGRVTPFFCFLDELAGTDRAINQRIFGVNMQMRKSRRAGIGRRRLILCISYTGSTPQQQRV